MDEFVIFIKKEESTQFSRVKNSFKIHFEFEENKIKQCNKLCNSKASTGPCLKDQRECVILT